MNKVIILLKNWISTVSFSNWIIACFTVLNVLLFYKFIGTSNIQVRFKDQISIQLGKGNLYFRQPMYFKNIGSKTGYVTKIEGYIRSKDRDASFERMITGNSYYKNESGENVFIELGLAPDENFSGIITLFKEPDRIARDSAGILETMILNEFDSASRNNPNQQIGIYNVSKFLDALIENFNSYRSSALKQGEYEYIVRLIGDNNKILITKCYSFVISPDNMRQFIETTKNFKKHSSFLNLNLTRIPDLMIPLTEIETPKIIESLKRELSYY